jgi:hypothetical protein
MVSMLRTCYGFPPARERRFFVLWCYLLDGICCRHCIIDGEHICDDTVSMVCSVIRYNQA